MRELTPERETRLIAAGRGGSRAPSLRRYRPAMPRDHCSARSAPALVRITRTVLPQTNAYAMIRRRAAAAGIATKLGNHSSRATGITAYLKNGGTLEKAAAMANHASTRTTQRYDRLRERSASMKSSGS